MSLPKLKAPPSPPSGAVTSSPASLALPELLEVEPELLLDAPELLDPLLDPLPELLLPVWSAPVSGAPPPVPLSPLLHPKKTRQAPMPTRLRMMAPPIEEKAPESRSRRYTQVVARVAGIVPSSPGQRDEPLRKGSFGLGGRDCGSSSGSL